MEKIEFHPKAIEDFTLCSERIAKLVEKKAIETQASNRPRFKPDLKTTKVLHERDIIQSVTSFRDTTGMTVGKMHRNQEGAWSLSGDGYGEAIALADRIYGRPETRNLMSKSFAERIVFDWLFGRAQESIALSFTDYLETRCNEGIKAHLVVIPIANMIVEREFRFGKIDFVPMTEKVIRKWLHASLELHPNRTDDIKKLFKTKVDRLQGFAAALVKLRGDGDRACEESCRLANVAVSVLRFFHPSSLDPRHTSVTVPRGLEYMPRNQGLMFDDEVDCIPRVREAFTHIPYPWTIDRGLLKYLGQVGMHEFSSLLGNENRSDFENTLVDVLMLFSNISIKREKADKLMYLLVAMETLFLKDTSESIAHNLAERLAVFTRPDLAGRKEVIKVIKSIYDKRSKFIHHGQRFEDVQLFQDALKIGWESLLKAVNGRAEVRSKRDFVEAIDYEKLS